MHLWWSRLLPHSKQDTLRTETHFCSIFDTVQGALASSQTKPTILLKYSTVWLTIFRTTFWNEISFVALVALKIVWSVSWSIRHRARGYMNCFTNAFDPIPIETRMYAFARSSLWDAAFLIFVLNCRSFSIVADASNVSVSDAVVVIFSSPKLYFYKPFASQGSF